ncbi:MAG: hypothetical protein ACRDIX_03155 [Actinomycetota bacterium]
MHEKRFSTVCLVLVFAYFFLITIPDAHAYIDPGTGSFIFQVIVGGLLAAGVIFRSFWRRVWSFLPRRNPRDKASRRLD